MTPGVEPESEGITFDSKSYVLSTAPAPYEINSKVLTPSFSPCYLVNLSKLLNFSVS